MSDYTNDLRYPKSGSLLFDTKDLVDVTISKTGTTRSMVATYTDPETGEVLQTTEGGGGRIPNEKLFTFDGVDLMSEDCLKYSSEPSADGRVAEAYVTYNYTLHLTEGAVCAASIKVGGTQYTSSGTVTKNPDSEILTLAIGFNSDAFGVIISEDSIGTMVEVGGEGISDDVSHTYAATISEAIGDLATAWQAMELIITIGS